MGKRYDPAAIPEIIDADGRFILVRAEGDQLLASEIQAAGNAERSN